MSVDVEDLYGQWRMQQEWIVRLQKVFVVGCAKSGTTWLMNLLNGHPEIVVRGEGAFTYQLLPLMSQAFAAFNKLQSAKDPITRLRDLDLIVTVRSMIDGQFARYVRESGKPPAQVRVVGDKTPQHAISLPELAQLYPHAKFIHIVRDPRDVATSAWFHFGRTDGRSMEEYIRYFITQVWPLNVGTAQQSAAGLADRYMEIRYEDLHGRELEYIERICAFLSVDASESSIQACLRSGDFKARSGGRQRGTTDANSFYRSGTAGDWRNHLPVDLAQCCCREIAPLMESCGYDPACLEATAA